MEVIADGSQHSKAGMRGAVCAALAVFAFGCGDGGEPRLAAVKGQVAPGAIVQAKAGPPRLEPVSGLLVRELAREVPEVAIFAPDAQKAELAAVEAMRARIPGASKPPASRPAPKAAAPKPGRAGAAVPRRILTAAVGNAQDMSPGAAIGGLLAVMSSLVPSGTPATGPVDSRGASGDVDGGVRMEIGTRPDGSTAFGMDFDMTGKKDGTAVQLRFGGRVEGDQCPDPGGKVSLKYRMTLAGQGSSGRTRFGSSQEIEGTATALVNDMATIASYDIDLHAQYSKQRPESHDAFVDFQYSISMADDPATGKVAFTRDSGKIIREGSKTTREDWLAMSGESQKAAMEFVMVYLYAVQQKWRDGACVVVRAGVPAKVKPGSSNAFEVSVAQKRDGTPIKAPVDATIEGQASLEPKRIDPAPGTATYVAGAKPGGTATLRFVSTSRRGIGKLEAAVRTGDRGYFAKGGQGISITGTICGGLDKPFTLQGSPPDGSRLTFSYTPAGEAGGTHTYSGRGGPFTMSGKGSYSVRPGAGDTLTITQTDTGCVTNVPFGGCRTYTNTITLTPADCGS